MKRIILIISALFASSALDAAQPTIVTSVVSAGRIATPAGAIRNATMGGYSAAPGRTAFAGLGFFYTVVKDTTPPVTDITLTGTSGQNGWYVSLVAVTLISTDNLSGVERPYYSVDGSSFALYASSFTIAAEGMHSLRYYAVDKAGNIEPEKEIALKLDLSVPLVTAVSSPTVNAQGWNNTAVTAVFSGTDAVSWIVYCEPNKLVSIEGDSQTVSGYCMDYAGWTSTAALVVNIDTTAPDAAYTVEPVPNSAGWNNSAVAVKFACADGLSGVKSCPADILLAGEGMNVSTSAVAYDYAGNAKSVLVSGVNIDKTAPISTAAVSGVYRNGWYSSPATIVLASTDTLSGVKGIFYSLDGGGYAAYMQPVVVSSEGKHLVSYYGEDKAGNNESAKTIEFGIDTTAPMVDYLLSPLPNADGWNAGPVSVVFRGSDTLSGIEECSSMTVTAESKDQKIAGWCRDLVGNVGYSTATLNIDLAQPVVSAAQVPVPNTYGWNKGAVEVSFAGTDALSGIAYCESAKTIFVEGASQTVSGYCMDYAGLTSTASVTVNLDNTAPSVAYERHPAANENGWNNSEVAVNFTCADALSGVASCPAGMTLSSEGINISTAAEAYDFAGNSAGTVVAGINIDRSLPVSTAALSGSYKNGYYGSSVIVTILSTDTLSGVAKTFYSLDGDIFVEYQSPIEVSAEGRHSVRHYTKDKAGNTEMEQIQEFNIDVAAPLVSYTVTPPANSNGWNNSSVEVVFTATDSAVGSVSCTPTQIVSGEGGNQKVFGSCADLAGNVAYSTAIVNIDFSAPEVLAAGMPAANTAGWNNGSITVSFGGTDAVSGISYCSPAEAIGMEVSSRTISGYCMDYAGHSSTAAYTLRIDTTPPAILISSPAAGGKYTGADLIKIDFSVSDNLSLVNSSAAYLRQVTDNGTPRGSLPDLIPVIAGQNLAASGVDDGAWQLIASATDYAGNYSSAMGGTFEVIHATVPPITARVKLNLEPDTLNLTSKGEDITAKLKIEGGNALCFKRTGINISAINGHNLQKPIYALNSNGRGDDDDNRGHNGGWDDNDKGHGGGYPGHDGNDSAQCGNITVKFDREAVIAVLPVNARVKVTVSGGFTNGQSFSADDTIKTIKPRRIARRNGGHFEHDKRACADAPTWAFKEDADLYVLSIESDLDERESHKEAAAKARGVSRRGLAYEFGPDGAVFDKPVTISLPYDADEKSPERLVVAYWNETVGAWETLPSRRDTANWLIKADVGHFSQYQVAITSYAASGVEPGGRKRISEFDTADASGADSTFKLGEVYVFPNPAKGGAKPVFHIETGIADSVEITVYTVSGRTAHQHTMTSVPDAIDDGNGIAYAYEYAWDGHIPSGVYYYSIKAEKAGRIFKKAGKFAVVR